MGVKGVSLGGLGNGFLAQMVERVLSMDEAQGSMPWRSTFFDFSQGYLGLIKLARKGGLEETKSVLPQFTLAVDQTPFFGRTKIPRI